MAIIDVDGIRRRLHEMQRDLARQIDELDGTTDDAPDFDENFADSAQVTAERDESVALANQIRDHLTDVDEALHRLDSGTYGVCEVCGEAIAGPRLEALPATRYCIEHA